MNERDDRKEDKKTVGTRNGIAFSCEQEVHFRFRY